MGPADAMVRAMNTKQQNTDYCRLQAREHDADRYFVSLFASAEKRPALWALIAFNQEVAKTRAVVSEAMLGEIRLQWWREALDGIAAGTPRAHPVVETMATEIHDFLAIRHYLDAIIDTWSDDFGGAQVTLAKLKTHAAGTGGALNAAMLRVLNTDASAIQLDLASLAGTVWSLMGVVRALPHELANPSSDWQNLLAETSVGTSGDTAQAVSAVSAVLPTVKTLLASVGEDIAALHDGLTHARKDAALRTVLGLVPLSTIEWRAANRVGDDLMALEKHQPGDARKLLALMKYQFFG